MKLNGWMIRRYQTNNFPQPKPNLIHLCSIKGNQLFYILERFETNFIPSKKISIRK